MKRLFALAVVLAVTVGGTAAANNRPHPEVNCVGTNIWWTYNTSLGCNVVPPQVLHLRYIPSNWTLAQAHTYCTGLGAANAQTLYAGTANVCPDIDY